VTTTKRRRPFLTYAAMSLLVVRHTLAMIIAAGRHATFARPFLLYELVTTDVAAAKAFYADVIGWGTQEAATGAAYTLLTAAGTAVSGSHAPAGSGEAIGFAAELGRVCWDR
jgi:Bleomycin resistance protein-like N-terminal